MRTEGVRLYEDICIEKPTVEVDGMYDDDPLMTMLVVPCWMIETQPLSSYDSTN